MVKKTLITCVFVLFVNTVWANSDDITFEKYTQDIDVLYPHPVALMLVSTGVVDSENKSDSSSGSTVINGLLANSSSSSTTYSIEKCYKQCASLRESCLAQCDGPNCQADCSMAESECRRECRQ